MYLVLFQSVLEAGKVGFLDEHGQVQRRVELLEHLPTLVRQAERLVGGEIPALVLPRADVVDGDQNAKHHQDADAGQCPVARLAAAERIGDLAPLPRAVGDDAGQPGPHQVRHVLF